MKKEIKIAILKDRLNTIASRGKDTGGTVKKLTRIIRNLEKDV